MIGSRSFGADATLVTSMTAGEKDVLFFQSSSEIVFYTGELRNIVKLFGMVFIVESLFEIAGVILCVNAWVEIYPDRIVEFQ